VDFEHDDEQKALRDAVRSLLTKAYGDWEDRRRVTAEDPGFSREVWGRLAEMGLLALPFSEEDGGVGAGPVEVGLVAEEMGRVLAPEPYLTAVVLAGGAIAAAGSAPQKEAAIGPLVEGSAVLGWAHAEPGTRRVGPSAAGTTATEVDGGWRLTGVKEPVVAGAVADLLVVTAALPEGGTGLFLLEATASGVSREGYRTHDGGRAARLSLEEAPASPLGSGGDATPVVSALLDIARVVAAHEVLGMMDRALTMTRDYLTSRHQFGVPLSTFQALTFRAADLYVSLELTRSVVQWAAMVLAAAQESGDTGAVPEAAARAALQAARGGRHVCEEAIQLHGGIAMTAEYAVGHYLSRLGALEQVLGDARLHLTALAGSVGSYGEVDPLP
jgi:alkylation response protein AidB-like acyl-CoA dehydrogenase